VLSTLAILAASTTAASARHGLVAEPIGDWRQHLGFARRLGISQHMVKFHVESLFRKLGAVTRADAVLKGLRQRLFEI
jgi:hypothetical protein